VPFQLACNDMTLASQSGDRVIAMFISLVYLGQMPLAKALGERQRNMHRDQTRIPLLGSVDSDRALIRSESRDRC